MDDSGSAADAAYESGALLPIRYPPVYNLAATVPAAHIVLDKARDGFDFVNRRTLRGGVVPPDLPAMISVAYDNLSDADHETVAAELRLSEKLQRAARNRFVVIRQSPKLATLVVLGNAAKNTRSSMLSFRQVTRHVVISGNAAVDVGRPWKTALAYELTILKSLHGSWFGTLNIQS